MKDMLEFTGAEKKLVFYVSRPGKRTNMLSRRVVLSLKQPVRSSVCTNVLSFRPTLKWQTHPIYARASFEKRIRRFKAFSSPLLGMATMSQGGRCDKALLCSDVLSPLPSETEGERLDTPADKEVENTPFANTRHALRQRTFSTTLSRRRQLPLLTMSHVRTTNIQSPTQSQ